MQVQVAYPVFPARLVMLVCRTLHFLFFLLSISSLCVLGPPVSSSVSRKILIISLSYRRAFPALPDYQAVQVIIFEILLQLIFLFHGSVVLGRNGYPGSPGEKGLPGIPGKIGRQGELLFEVSEYDDVRIFFLKAFLEHRERKVTVVYLDVLVQKVFLATVVRIRDSIRDVI